jgi:hypothetical protein
MERLKDYLTINGWKKDLVKTREKFIKYMN